MNRFNTEKKIVMGFRGSVGLLCGLFLLGGLSGCFFLHVLDMSELQGLCDYLSDYLSVACTGLLSHWFWPTVRSRLWEFFILVLAGMTWFGIVLIPLCFWIRGFLLSFSIGCFFRVYGIAGALPAGVLFLIPALFWAPAVFWLGISGTDRSLLRLWGEVKEDGRIPWMGISFSCGFFVLCVMVECFIVPVLLRVAARAVL